MEDYARLIEAVAKLLGVVIWPAILIYVVVRFRAGIGNFLADLAEISFKGAGIDFSAKSRQRAVVASLTAASATKAIGEAGPDVVARDAQEALQIATEAVSPRTIRDASGSTALWVDNNPNGNKFERQALEALGIKFVLATSTDEAIKLLHDRRFDVVISDMSRLPEREAGLNLFTHIKAAGIRAPFIIYSSPRGLKGIPQNKLTDTFGVTTRANELFTLVLSALNSSRG